MQSSFFDHDQIGHTEGIRLWSGSVWQRGGDAHSSETDGGEVDMAGEGMTANINIMGKVMSTENLQRLLGEMV